MNPTMKDSGGRNSSTDAVIEDRHVRNPASQLEDITYSSLGLLSPWFPQVDPDHPRAKTWRTWKSRREIVLRTCLGTTTIVCVINFVLAMILWSHYELTDGVATLYQGDCDYVRRMNTGLHILINILSTLLLGASNLTLQLVAAPTRREINNAHRNRAWLDISVPSLRNLGWISRTSLAIWYNLATSPIPIHFL